MELKSSKAPPIDNFASINWASWKPDERATLVFVLNGDKILLIRKKRGLGAGKITGPGGRVDGEESLQDCAMRELREEVGLQAKSLSAHGDIAFQFADGYALHVFIFVTHETSGVAIETDEAQPHWFPIDNIPYDEMWEDDRYWMPQVLAGQSVSARFLFDGDAMLGKAVETRPS